MKHLMIVATLATLLLDRRREGTIHRSRVVASPCQSADVYSASVVADLRRVLSPSSTRPFDTAFRAASHLPATPDSAIVVISDSLACARALSTYLTQVDSLSPIPTQIYVVRVASFYDAWVPKAGRSNHVVMDSSFTVLGGFLK